MLGRAAVKANEVGGLGCEWMRPHNSELADNKDRKEEKKRKEKEKENRKRVLCAFYSFYLT